MSENWTYYVSKSLGDEGASAAPSSDHRFDQEEAEGRVGGDAGRSSLPASGRAKKETQKEGVIEQAS